MSFETLLIAAGTGMKAAGSLYEGAAGKAAAEYNAAVATRNAGLARSQAAADMGDKARENRRYLGELRANFGASGLAFEGSALDIFEDQAAEAELEQRRIRYSGELRAIGFTEKAELERMKGKAASTAGILGAISAVVEGGSNYYRSQTLKRAPTY